MSFFYLSPVKGDITVNLLEVIVTKRLQFLNALQQNKPQVYNEYVIEGSIHDSIGHFMLLIIYKIENTTEYTDFYLRAEEKLFCQRVDNLSAYELRRFAKHLLKSIKKLEIDLYFFEPLRILLQHFNVRKIAHHITTKCCENCSLYYIKVNFKHCIRLVAKRRVELTKGTASIPCGYWKVYLSHLFTICLTHKIKHSDTDILKNDPRIIDICRRIKQQMKMFKDCQKTSILKSCEVDIQSQFFPPCMFNLHQHLRRKHRLTHNQRFYYSLFLKDLGLPVHEAVDFWRTEYEKEPNGRHSCSHSWEKDEKKFIYGIRHLYGLEGARKNYKSGNCQRIQTCDGPCSEGGCPFKSFEEDKMLEILNIEETHPVLIQIKELRFQRNYMSACQIYFQIKYPYNKCDNLNYNFTPLKFYSEASKPHVN